MATSKCPAPLREQLTETTTRINNEPRLVGVLTCLAEVFPDAETAPGKRTFHEWMSRGYFPVYRIGRRVFLDPCEVRRALERRFKVNAVEVR